MIEMLLALFLGRTEALTPLPVHLGPEEVVLKAAKPISPVSENMTVFIGLGKPTDDVRSNLLTPEGRAKLPKIGVQICSSESKCIAAKSSGPYLTKSEYGIELGFDPGDVKSRSFSTVKIVASEPIEGATASWKNWSK